MILWERRDDIWYSYQTFYSRGLPPCAATVALRKLGDYYCMRIVHGDSCELDPHDLATGGLAEHGSDAKAALLRLAKEYINPTEGWLKDLANNLPNMDLPPEPQAQQIRSLTKLARIVQLLDDLFNQRAELLETRP